ncbi:uncharacterized protein LOC141818390 [Curcuma longa]|uniref:uncharacterized protein LOC141818390 n=1 Tax=Curcuma longa TaxID=136217 RepID=UPI003D9F8184
MGIRRFSLSDWLNKLKHIVHGARKKTASSPEASLSRNAGEKLPRKAERAVVASPVDVGCSRRVRRRCKPAPVRLSKKAAQWQGKGVLAGSSAVVKASADPQRDFRESMVEMIVENGITGSGDLAELLALYLSLNSGEFHGLIVKVFQQILFDLKFIFSQKQKLEI